MKTILILSACLFAATQAAGAQAEQMAEQFATFQNEMKAFKLRQTQQEADSYEGKNPMLGRNLASVLFTDIFNIFYDPSWVSFTAFFVDIAQFLFTPLIGGMVNASVYVNYQEDIVTYQHAGLDMQYLYGSSMLFAKDALYSALGRPDFYDTGNPYQAASEPYEVSNFPQSNSDTTSQDGTAPAWKSRWPHNYLKSPILFYTI